MTFDVNKVRLRGDPELRDHLREIVGGGAGLFIVLDALESIAKELAKQEEKVRQRDDRAQLYLSLARTLRRATMKALCLEVPELRRARGDQEDTDS
jgi:hypothetical protein